MINTGYIIEVGINAFEGVIRDYSLEFYIERGENTISYNSDRLVRVDTEKGARYFAYVDSTLLGRGNLMCRVTIFDKEALFPERQMVYTLFTGIVIGDCLCSCGVVERCGDYEFSFSCVENIPKDVNAKVYYGVIKDWVIGYEYITEEMAEALVATSTENLIESVVIPVSKGDKLAILVPCSEFITPKKDDGFGGKLPFNTSLMGVNGDLRIRIGHIDYRIYGEFFTVEGEVKIYFK